MYQTSFEGRLLTINLALARMMGFDSTEDNHGFVHNRLQ